MALTSFSHYAKKDIERISKCQTKDVTLMTAELFHYFLQKFYRLPESLKIDIKYCERHLMEHTEIYNIIAASDKVGEYAAACETILAEISGEIAEMKAEFKALMDQLYESTSDFRKMLVSRGFDIIPELTKPILRQEVDNANSSKEQLKPINVKQRGSIEAVWQRYNELKKQKKKILHKELKSAKVARKNLSTTKSTAVVHVPIICDKASNDDIDDITVDPITQLEFLKIFGLCSRKEREEIILSQLNPKRRSRSAAKRKNADFIYETIEQEPEPKRRKSTPKNKK